MKRIILHIVILSLFIPAVTNAQAPGYHIRNYLPKEYKGFNQMWHAIQDKNGLLYFASTSNVFVFSGKHWERIPVKSGSAVRQIALDSASGIIYVAVAGDFGYLERDRLGKFCFISIIGQLSAKQKQFNDVWKILPMQGNLYFQSSERIFIVKNKKVIDVIESPDQYGFALAFLSGEHMYVRKRKIGLMEIRGNKLLPVAGGEVFADRRVLAIIPFKTNQNLILTGDEGFFRMYINPDPSDKQTAKIELYKSDKFLEDSGVIGAVWLNDSVFCVHTRAGIAFYDKNADQKELINKASGLSDEVIAEVFVDKEKNVWLMHNNGISCIGYNSNSFVYYDNSGFKGMIEFVKKSNGTLYMACGGGLFKIKQDPLSHGVSAISTEIKNTEVWDLHTMNNTLFVATSNGLMKMNKDKSELLTNNLTNRISSLKEVNMLVTAEKGGFSVIDVKPGKSPVIQQHYPIEAQELLKTGRIDKCKGEEDLYETWAVSRQNKLFHLKFGKEKSRLIIKSYDSINGVYGNENYMVYIGDSTFICNANACYRYVAKKDISASSVCFEEAPWIYKTLREGECKNVKEPFDFRLTFPSSDPAYTTCFGYNKKGELYSKKVMLGSVFYDNSLQCGVIFENGDLWALTHEFFAIYNVNAPDNDLKDFKTIVQSVSVGKDSVIFMGSESQNIVNSAPLEYIDNSISFSFDAPVFKQNNRIYFSCRLDGYDTTWSKPSLATEKNYTNLYEGTYTFRVRSIDSYGNTSIEGSYTFTISPPWYRSYYAYFIYVVLFLLVMYLTVKISAGRLRKQKNKLEAMVKERTAEVVSQKLMLETAYVEIKDSIRYAKRIQNALLASDQLLNKHLNEYFIYYKPKDIVSGDFYWAHPKDEWFYMITADCTGHGVPGAFMSLLNISFLNEAINYTGFISPDEILGIVRSRIIEALRSDGSEEGGKDGMDCVLCAYNFKTKQLLFAAANNPVWICRNKNIIEYKPDKYPVGKHDRENEPFHLHSIQLETNDIVYTFTDGYADQFGGPSGKKFKVKQLKDLLISVAHLPMNEQKDVVSKTIRKWKKGIDQIDDILVIGVKII